MKEIVKVLLQEGICEEVIHEVLDVIEEKYELVDESEKATEYVKAKLKAARKEVGGAQKKYEENPNKENYWDLKRAERKRDGYSDIRDTAEITKIKGETKATELENKKTGKPKNIKSQVWDNHEKERYDDRNCYTQPVH